MVESLVSGEVPSTKAALKILTSVTSAKHSLVVLERGDELTLKSLRNVPTVHLLFVDQLNTYDVLVNEDVVFTAAALTAYVGGDLELAPAKPSTKKADATTDAKADADEKPAKAPKKKAAKADAQEDDK